MDERPTTSRDNGTAPGAGDQEQNDEIDLMRYVLLLWRHWSVIAVSAILCGVATFSVSMLITPLYEATAKLVVTPPKTGAPNEEAPVISVATFRVLVENQSLCAQIVTEFGLDKEPHRLTPSAFVRRRLSVATVPDTNVILVGVRLSDAALAAKVANRLAEAAEDLSSRLNQDETVTARDAIKAQLDQSRTRLAESEQRLEAFKREAQLDLVRRDVDALLAQRGTLLPLLIDIQAERARLSQAEALLKEKDKIETLKRSIDMDPAAMEAIRRGGDSGSVLPLQLRNEFVNPVYESLDQVIATSRTRLAGLEKQKTELIDVRKLDSNQQAKLDLLYKREAELARLQTEYDLSKAAYVDVATRYEQARVQVAGRSAQLQLLDTALPPDRPVTPRPVRASAVALLAGFWCSIMGVLFTRGVQGALKRERGSQA